MALALMSALGTSIAATSSQFLVLATAAFVGMFNGMGRDRGAALILDQAILPATTGNRDRTRGFAWYNVLQDVGHALGALLAAAPVLLREVFELEELTSIRLVVMGNALLLVASAALYGRLSPAAEAPGSAHRVSVSADSRRAVWKISALFGIDSVAGGFLTASLLAFFFFERFGARVANAASHLGAAWLASRETRSVLPAKLASQQGNASGAVVSRNNAYTSQVKRSGLDAIQTKPT